MIELFLASLFNTDQKQGATGEISMFAAEDKLWDIVRFTNDKEI